MEKFATEKITNAIARMFIKERNGGVLREFTLKVRRRVDLITFNENSQISIVEIKSSPRDFLRDKKWSEYLEWADHFYFGVAEDFPLSLLPKGNTCGVIITDGFDSYEIQQAPTRILSSPRRNMLVRRMAKVAMTRFEYTRNNLLKPSE